MELAYSVEVEASASSETRVRQRLHGAIVAYGSSLRRFVRRMGLPEEDAEDVVQESFIALLQKSSSVPVASERSFLYRAALNLVIERRRNFARRREESRDAESLEEFATKLQNPEEALTASVRLAILERILSKMPLDLRTALVLCEIEELSAERVSEILGVPIGTVRSRLRRGREFLERLARQWRVLSAREDANEERTRG